MTVGGGVVKGVHGRLAEGTGAGIAGSSWDGFGSAGRKPEDVAGVVGIFRAWMFIATPTKTRNPPTRIVATARMMPTICHPLIFVLGAPGAIDHRRPSQ
jgi:hypothetical protein